MEIGNILEKTCIVGFLRFRGVNDVDTHGLFDKLFSQFVVGGVGLVRFAEQFPYGPFGKMQAPLMEKDVDDVFIGNTLAAHGVTDGLFCFTGPCRPPDEDCIWVLKFRWPDFGCLFNWRCDFLNDGRNFLWRRVENGIHKRAGKPFHFMAERKITELENNGAPVHKHGVKKYARNEVIA